MKDKICIYINTESPELFIEVKPFLLIIRPHRIIVKCNFMLII